MKGGETTVKTWEKTRVQNLMRHKSGRYYARLYLGGKEVWKPLETAHFSVAEARMAAARKEIREQRSRTVVPANAKLTFGDAAKLHLQHVDADNPIGHAGGTLTGHAHPAPGQPYARDITVDGRIRLGSPDKSKHVHFNHAGGFVFSVNPDLKNQ